MFTLLLTLKTFRSLVFIKVFVQHVHGWRVHCLCRLFKEGLTFILFIVTYFMFSCCSVYE